MKLEHPFFVLDVESNGLYGQPFCVGAVLMDPGGRVLNEFISRCPLDQVPDDYVEENVLPALDEAGIKEDAGSLRDMQEKFVEWRGGFREELHLYVDAGFPVDTGFLRGLEGLEGWKSPYPLLDVASQLAAMGTDPDSDRLMFVNDILGVRRGRKHDPRWDAEVSGLCVVMIERTKSRTLKLLGDNLWGKLFPSMNA